MKSSTNLRFLLFPCIIFLLFNGCSTDDDATKEPIISEPPTSEQELILEEDVQIIDSLRNPLVSTDEQIDNGIYSFGGAEQLEIEQGEVIVGDQGYGFLRRVTKVEIVGQMTVLTTEPASLNELFKSGILKFSLNEENLLKSSVSKIQDKYTLPSETFYSNSSVEIKLLGGNLDYQFDWDYDISFNEGDEYFVMKTEDSYFNTDFLFEVKTGQQFLLNPDEKIFKSWTYPFWIKVPVVILGVPGYIPIKAVLKNDLVMEYGGKVKGEFTREIALSSYNNMTIGVEYKNNQWNNLFDFSNTNKLDIVKKVGYEEAEFNMGLVLKSKVLILNKVGPFIDNGLYGDLNLAVSSTEDWNFRAEAYLKSTLGITGLTFFDSMKDYFPYKKSDSIAYITPYKIERISGDNQIGMVEKILPEPLKVKVTDSRGKPQSKVPVYFQPRQSNGVSLPEKVFTDEEGLAESNWKLGNINDELQFLDVSAKNPAGTPINNAPVEFAAAVVGLKIEVNKGDKENTDENGEVEVELLVSNENNEPVKDELVRVSSTNQNISYTPIGPFTTDVNGLVKFKIKVKPENTEKIIPILAVIKNDSGELLVEKKFEIFDNPLIGTWDMISYLGGLQPGEKYFNTVYDCPSVPLSWEVWHAAEWVVTLDRFSFYVDEEAVFYQIDLDEACNIIEDDPDIIIERRKTEVHGEYTFENGILTLIYDEGTDEGYNGDGDLGGETETVLIKFLNETGTILEFVDEDDEGTVFKKR